MLPAALASAPSGAVRRRRRAAEPLAPTPAAAAAVRRGAPPDIKALAVTQLVVPARAPDCDTELRAQVAPNGEAVAGPSGYVDGYPVANPGEEMQVLVDNIGQCRRRCSSSCTTWTGAPTCATPTCCRTRSLTIDKLAAGRYEVRYQNVFDAGAPTDCAAQLKQAAAAP